MSKLDQRLRAILALLCVAALFSIAACGQDSNATVTSEPAAGITIASDRAYTVADFELVGFKNSKTYDVSDLPNALVARYGFWGLDPYHREDYEVRFYASHDDAVTFGRALAEERVGKGAKLTEETATWKVGVRDARECHGVQGQSQHAASCTEAKYYDYMIVGNIVLLCPGDAMDVARENCDKLMAQVN